MISRTQAERIMEEYLRGMCRGVPGSIAIINEYTLEKPYGWVFFYDTRRFIETGDPDEMLIGNSPILIEAASGRMTALGTGRPVERSLRSLESARGLDLRTNCHIRLR